MIYVLAHLFHTIFYPYRPFLQPFLVVKKQFLSATSNRESLFNFLELLYSYCSFVFPFIISLFYPLLNKSSSLYYIFQLSKDLIIFSTDTGVKLFASTPTSYLLMLLFILFTLYSSLLCWCPCK